MAAVDPARPCPNRARYALGSRPCLTAALDARKEPKDAAGYADAHLGWHGFWAGPLQRDLLRLCPTCERGLPRILAGASLWVSDVHREARAFRTTAAFRSYRARIKAEDRGRLAPYPRGA